MRQTLPVANHPCRPRRRSKGNDMDIKILASGSKGNAYVIDDGRTKLLLECGIPAPQIQRALNFQMLSCWACLISHDHKDHSLAAPVLGMLYGMDIYASAGTLKVLDFTSHNVHPIAAKTQFSLGSWDVMPFATVHDAAEPLGFLLQSGDERLLYATDTEYVPVRFEGITQVMIEANYDMSILKDNVRSGEVDRALKHRVIHSHMSIETVKGMLGANDLSKLKEVVLLHLSDNNSDAQDFKRQIQELTGVPVRIA